MFGSLYQRSIPNINCLYDGDDLIIEEGTVDSEDVVVPVVSARAEKLPEHVLMRQSSGNTTDYQK